MLDLVQKQKDEVKTKRSRENRKFRNTKKEKNPTLYKENLRGQVKCHRSTKKDENTNLYKEKLRSQVMSHRNIKKNKKTIIVL